MAPLKNGLFLERVVFSRVTVKVGRLFRSSVLFWGEVARGADPFASLA